MNSTVEMIMSTLSIFSTTVVELQFPSIFSIDETVPGPIEYEFPKSLVEWVNALAMDTFPTDFHFGTATSAYQHEGAWNVDGKGESVWDFMTHTYPNLIIDHTNADVSSDSYHNYKEDILLAKSIGVKMFSVSLSWSRILPNGRTNNVNADGVRYYNNLIDNMIQNGIIPMITLFHWDLPYNLQQLGGWTNSIMSELFMDYARLAFDSFGDRVKYWVTINEPSIICSQGYGQDRMIPALNQSGIADYICAHNLLLAHAKVYRMYDREYRSVQRGKVGISHRYMWFEAADPVSLDDVYADSWYNGWILHPIFSEIGDYPLVMTNVVRATSVNQGFGESRFPKFSDFEVAELYGSADFLGINYFMPSVAYTWDSRDEDVGFEDDAGIRVAYKEKWASLNPLKNKTEILKDILLRINKDYAVPEIFVTQNGCADAGDVIDVNRIIYHHHRISEVLEAMKEGIPVKGYLAWSLLDGFEWDQGYTQKYGIFQVDFHDSMRKRVPKLSAKLFAEIYTTKSLPDLTHFLNTTVTNDVALLAN